MTTRPTLPVEFPWDRKRDHFSVGDKVRVFYNWEWHEGIVRDGYRHHDGCVSYRLYDIGPQESGFWGCGVAVPTVLLESEYQYLKANVDYYKWWRSAVTKPDYNGNRVYLPFDSICEAEPKDLKTYEFQAETICRVYYTIAAETREKAEEIASKVDWASRVEKGDFDQWDIEFVEKPQKPSQSHSD